MEANGVKPSSVFIHICCSFIRTLYHILDCSWEDILKGLVIATSSDPSKCSYYILYTPILLIDHHELKAFTELVHTITGEKFDNGWNELEHARVQPPTSLGLGVRLRMLSIEKNNNHLRISVRRDILRKYVDLVLQKYSNYLRDWTIEEKDSDERGEIFECDPSIAEKIQQENKNSLQPSHKVKTLGFPKAFVKMPSWVKYNETLTATETYEERYVRPLPNEGDIYVGSSWDTGKTYILEHLTISDVVNLLVLTTRHSYSNAVTTRLNLKSYCNIDGNINLPDHKRV
ncbi:hypothetical protein RhiirC2_801526, partial [Rhizophagus irregularis]